MNKRTAKDLLEFTFDELDKAVNEKSDELAEEENKSQEKHQKKTDRNKMDNEECFGAAVSNDEDSR